MDSPTRYRPPHQPQISSFEHQHIEGHRSHYAQAGHRQVRFRQHSQDQPAPHPDLSMANHDRVGHGFHRQFQALSLRETSNVPPRECFLPWDINQRLREGFLFLNPKSFLKRNPKKALSTAEEILAQGTNLSRPDTMEAYLLKVRALFALGRFGECLGEFETLEMKKIELNEGLLAAKGRALQAMSRFTEALPIFKGLYSRSKNEKSLIVNGLALGRLYQEMGEHQEALMTFKELRASRSGYQDTPCKDIELAIARQYLKMGKNEKALTTLKKVRTYLSGREDMPCDDKGIELAVGRLRQEKGEHDEALKIFKHLRTVRSSGHEDMPCDDKEVELALGRLYQKMKEHDKALKIVKHLRIKRSGHEDMPCDDKDIELAVGRLHQEKGEHNEALTTLEELRIVNYARHKDTGFKDKKIELAIGLQYQKMKKYEEALATFEGLRTVYYARHKDTAFKDKDIELAIGRLYQEKGKDEEALTTLKALRTVYYARQKDSAFKDKDIELAVGRLYQKRGEHQMALTTLKALRTFCAGHEDTPCNDKEVELAIGDIFVDSKNWHQYDQMQLDQKGFAGPEVDVSISIRYFYECISTCQDKEISGLLGKAIKYACNAIEKSQYLDASSFSQLAHCLRLVALLPAEKVPNTAKEGEVPLKEIYTQLFDEATRLDPGRSNRLKNESWRNTENEYLKRLGVTSTSEEACVRMEEEHRT